MRFPDKFLYSSYPGIFFNLMKWKSRYTNNDFEPEDVQQAGTPIFLNIPSRGNDEGFMIPPNNIRVIDNKVLFYGVIEESTILELNRTLMELDTRLQNVKNALGEDYEPIIHLHLQTPGGEVYAALSTVNLIERLKSKVYTYIDGAVASAGTLISMVGHKRFAFPYSHLLIHQLSGGMYGKFSEMEDDFYNSKNLMELLKNMYKKYTKIPMKNLNEILKRDIWLSAEECLAYKIVDEIK